MARGFQVFITCEYAVNVQANSLEEAQAIAIEELPQELETEHCDYSREWAEGQLS